MRTIEPISDSALKWFDENQHEEDFDGYLSDSYPEIRKRMVDTENKLRIARESFDALLTLCEHCADFRNGVEDNGVDEGSVKAWRWVQELKDCMEKTK